LSLGCLLWSASRRASAVRAAARGYGSVVAPSGEELNGIEAAMWTRPLVLACWSFVTGRAPLTDMASRWTSERAKMRRAAATAVSTLEQTRPS
jgi:hypothetical protein